MSTTQASQADDRDFPRLNGRNFVIWKTRITAALDGKGLLGFVEHPDYTGDSEPDFSADDDLDPANCDLDPNATKKMLDDIGATAEESPDESSSGGSSDSESATNEDDDVDMEPKSLPTIQSFSAQKQDDLKRAEKLKAMSSKLSSRQLRQLEAKARAFLIKTIDDHHVLMVKDKTTAFEIFQTLCSKYEGSAVHGDGYYIQGWLMDAKYQEGSSFSAFIYELEEAMKNSAAAIEGPITDIQKSSYLHHALPASWKADLSIWLAGRRSFSYEELKRLAENKIRDEQARLRYANKHGTPESRETSAETALQVKAPVVAMEETALASLMKCTYCGRDNHDTSDCYILQRHLHNGQVKEGTVLPANFKIKPPKPNHRQHPYQGDTRGSYSRPNLKGTSHHGNPRHKGSNQGRHNNGRDNRRDYNNGDNNKSRGTRNKFRGRRSNGSDDDDHEYGIIAITAPDLSSRVKAVSLTAFDVHQDPVWTVDSGCTRHVTWNPQWFVKLTPTSGKTITVGGNHQIPIEGSGDVELKIQDTKGKERVIILNNVLYAPELKFNLLSVRQAVGNDFKINFPTSKKCSLFFAHRVKFEAKTGDDSHLYQFHAKPANNTGVALAATSGSG